MRSTRKKKRAMSAEIIGRMADKGKDVSRFFTRRGSNDEPNPACKCTLHVADAGRIGQCGEGTKH